MLYISRWKATAILLATLLVCLFAVPNFFSERTIKSWPSWAQRHLVLGLDLQGGSHILLEVDSAAVRREKLQTLLDDVRRTLRDARGPMAVAFNTLALPFAGTTSRSASAPTRRWRSPSCASCRSRSAAC